MNTFYRFLSNRTAIALICASLFACGGHSYTSDPLTASNPPSASSPNTDVQGVGAFSYIVFGDFNLGGCDRTKRVKKIIDRMAAEKNVAFFVNTGDIIDGYVQSDGSTLCFASDPVAKGVASACVNGAPNGNISEMLAPIKNRQPVAGLKSALYMAIGNHDDNWGDGWYPDPCGDGICDFLSPQKPDDYINHPYGDMCAKTPDASAHSADFYYSFSYRNSYFIVLRQNNDYYGMLSCNSLGDSQCADYCADEKLINDAARNQSCYNVKQFDWLRSELQHAQSQYEHIFVFAHAPLLTTGEDHQATFGAKQIRDLLERYNVEIYFNGHNHAYERTFPIKGLQNDKTGTVYLTVGSSGAEPYANSGNQQFSAVTYHDWIPPQSYTKEKMAVFLRVDIDGKKIVVKTYSLGMGNTPVDLYSR